MRPQPRRMSLGLSTSIVNHGGHFDTAVGARRASCGFGSRNICIAHARMRCLRGAHRRDSSIASKC
jgi:hypothetical protein